MKKLVSLVLAVSLLLSIALPALAASEPIVLQVVAQKHIESTSEGEDQWWWKYVEWWFQQKGYNVEIDVVSHMDWERVNLQLNTNKLPDILWGWDLGKNNTMTYGVEDEVLLDFTPYMTEEYMPNLMKQAAEDSNVALALAECQAPNGGYYTLPEITGFNIGEYNWYGGHRMYWNKEMLDACNLEVPTTLDGLLETLRTIKANYKHPDGLEIYPAGSTQVFFEQYMLQAFGWMDTYVNRFGNTLCLTKDGELVLPCYTPEYKDYLTLIKTMYDEGLVANDHWSVTEETVRARISNGQIALMGDWTLSTADEAHFQRWVSAKPLTSKYTDKMTTINSTPGYQYGWTFASAETKHPELIAMLIDYMYTGEGASLYLNGFKNAEDDPLGLCGGYYVDENNKVHFYAVENGKYKDNADYQRTFIGNFLYVAQNKMKASEYFNEINNIDYEKYYVGEFTDAISGLTRRMYNTGSITPDNSDGYWRITNWEAWKDNTTFVNLPKVFVSTEISEELTDNSDGMYVLATNESIKFITGQRSLDEFDDFYEELASLGLDRWLELQNEIYHSYIVSVFGEK